MKQSPYMNYCFYQDNHTNVILTNGQVRRIMRHTNVVLAERCISLQQDVTLIATEANGSNIQTLKGSEHHTYSAYGYASTLPSPESETGFTSQRMDPATRNYLLGTGYRVYSPFLMRFHAPDDLSPFDRGGLNAYGYCIGDPINFVDPDGHMPQIPMKKPAAYYKAKSDRLVEKHNQILEKRNKHFDRLANASSADQNRDRLYRLSGKKSQKNWVTTARESVAMLDKELDRLKLSERKAYEKYKTLTVKAQQVTEHTRANVTASQYAPSAPPLSLMPTDVPTAFQANAVSNHAPSAPSLGLIMEDVRARQGAR